MATHIPLDPEDLAATLGIQYALQIRLLLSLNLISDGGITAIDGKRYPPPTSRDVLARMQTPAIRTKLTQGFDTLLLIPFGLSLDRFTDAWRQGLTRNKSALQSVGQFNDADPLWVWDRYRTEPLVYDPRSFTRDHGGRTKAKMLAGGSRAWDVLLVEGALQSLPLAGHGAIVGNRPQLECGRSPQEYLDALTQSGEVGLTPEAYILHFVDALERRGQVLDTETFSFLHGAFLSLCYRVPDAAWDPVSGRAFLVAGDQVNCQAHRGVRAAVRVP